MQEALFVLEKTAQNWGSSNKSKNSVEEHKEALRILQEFSESLKDKRDLDATSLCKNLLSLLNPSKSSLLSLVESYDSELFKIEAVKLITNLVSGEKTKAKKFALELLENGLFDNLILLFESKKLDKSIVRSVKKLVLSVIKVVPCREILQKRKFMKLLISLMKAINTIESEEKYKNYGDILDFITLEFGNTFTISQDLSNKLKSEVVTHLLKALSVNLISSCNKLYKLSEERDVCFMIAEKEGVRRIVEECFSRSRKNQLQRLALKILKNVLKSISEVDSISLYEEILETGGVKSLDDFVDGSKTNRTFSERMLRQQALQRTKSKKSIKKFKVSENISLNSGDI